jgi:hypothetical protein
MPEPREGETQSAYVSRCISYLISNEGKSPSVAAGQCHGMWDSAQKRRRDHHDEEESD